MKPTLLATFALTLSAFAADPLTLEYPGGNGPGKGKHIVLLAGDEEYRSEEAMPQLAKILSERHGFHCTVVFSINKTTGEIDPNTQDNEPGIEAMKDADLCITLLRFRKWPEEQTKYFVDYYNAGKPFICLRTSTHAFSGVKAPYDSLNKFGKQVLGEQWVNHWGSHKKEATRGVIEPGAEKNPLLNGVTDIFGTTDVYEAYPPADAKILVRGIVLKGLNHDDAPADYKKKRSVKTPGPDGTPVTAEQGVNDPAMPVVWTRDNKTADGKINHTLTTTMAAASDLPNESLRRLIVNAAYSFTGLEIPAKADVAIVGTFEPSMYGFGGFKKGVKPADLAK